MQRYYWGYVYKCLHLAAGQCVDLPRISYFQFYSTPFFVWPGQGSKITCDNAQPFNAYQVNAFLTPVILDSSRRKTNFLGVRVGGGVHGTTGVYQKKGR